MKVSGRLVLFFLSFVIFCKSWKNPKFCRHFEKFFCFDTFFEIPEIFGKCEEHWEESLLSNLSNYDFFFFLIIKHVDLFQNCYMNVSKVFITFKFAWIPSYFDLKKYLLFSFISSTNKARATMKKSLYTVLSFSRLECFISS